MKSRLRVVCCGVLSLTSSLLLAACEEEKPHASSAPSAVAAAPAPTPSPTPPPAPAIKKDGERPSKLDTELTAARRESIEAKYPAAKGFLAVSDVQAKLKANKTLKDKKIALAAFDKLARGKWLLFTGPLVNLTDDTFDIGLEYTPQLPNDPMGMSRQFFEVSLSKVEGYSKEPFKSGSAGVVLAKYNGAAQASPGYELVSQGVWK